MLALERLSLVMPDTVSAALIHKCTHGGSALILKVAQSQKIVLASAALLQPSVAAPHSR